MGRAYTERILAPPASSGTTYATVPAGYRIVVKSLAARNDQSQVGNIVLLVADHLVYQVTIPASAGSSITYETRQVAYAGERIGLSISGFVSCMLSGYVFQDTVGRMMFPISRDVPRPEGLPSPLPEPR